MAVFNKINERRGLIVTSIVVALLLFIVGAEVSNPSSVFRLGSKNIAVIDGKSISEKDYQQLRTKTDLEIQALYGRNMDENFVNEQVWSQLIYRYGYEPQFDKLGLTVTNGELDGLKDGKFIHNHIKTFFTGGGQYPYDPKIVQNFFANFDKVSQEGQTQWLLWENKLPEVRLREKYTNLLKKTEYVTKSEAKYNYIAQTEKAEVKLLFVPYYSVADTAVKVTDDMMKEYLASHLKEYKVEDGRTIDYVIFDVKPSGKDSAAIFDGMKDVKTAFQESTNDTAFVKENSNNPAAPAWVGMKQLPAELGFVETLAPGNVYGPFANPQTNSLELYKVVSEKEDTSSTLLMKATHILVQVDKMAPEDVRAKAKAKAEDLLARAKAGENFSTLAAQNSDDKYSAMHGGMLPWFGKNEMVAPFENACFGAKKTGVVPTLVETDYGYHIINVISLPKKGKQFLVATVSHDIYASDETKDQIAKKADEFRQAAEDTTKFYAAVKKDNLNKQTHAQLRKNDRNINGVPNAREIVRWAFKDADINDISEVINIDNGSMYVIAVLRDKTEEGYAELKDKKDEIRTKVLNQEKAKIIQAKLDKMGKKPLDQMATEYGNGAQFATAPDLTLQGSYAPQVGYDPTVLGRVFGMKPGSRTAVLAGETGVVIIEVVSVTKAPEIADYGQYKNQVRQNRESRDSDTAIDQVINKLGDVEDNRYLYF